MIGNLVRACVFVSLGWVTPQVASAHHAASIHYDMTDIAEVAGRVTSVQWANPHTVITVEGREDGGIEAEWRIEAAAAAMILRTGIERDSVSVGDAVRAAGYRGRRNANAIFMQNFLLADGREWRSSRAIEPRWTEDLVGTSWTTSPLGEPNAGPGLFKVWSLDESTLPETGPPRPLWNDSYPLTAFAEEMQRTWGNGAENPYVNCANGMPAIMDTPIPMEFVRDGDNVVLRFEELDARRLIVMADSDRSPTPGPYGYSTGRWEGESLVVRTVAIDWPWFDQDGIPLTENTEILERFTPSPDGQFLNYIATVVDEAVFTEPVVLDRRFADLLGEEVQAYECQWDESTL